MATLNATDCFLRDVMEQFNASKHDAEKVLRVFKKVKAIKFDSIAGGYTLTHGAYWEPDVIQNAIEWKE